MTPTPNLVDLLLKQGLEILKKEDVKANLRDQYRALVKIIFQELNIYIYITLVLIFLIFIMLLVILFILVIRVIPFRESINILEIPHRGGG